jgi:hypothetical protein
MADVQKFLEDWKSRLGDRDKMEAIVADDAVLLSPAFYAPKKGKKYVMQVLGSVNGGMEDFTIQREWVQDDTVIFEFTSRLGDIQMKGVDIITINDDNKLQQIEVLIRPINALMAMAEHVKDGFKQRDAAAE